MSAVWITGGKGFIGRNLAKYISTYKVDIFGIGHGSWSTGEYSMWGYQSWMSAEIDNDSLSLLASDTGLPKTIYHLAGGSAVHPSILNPYEDFQRTVDTTARLLEWVRQNSPQTRVIGISSAAVYGAGFEQPIKEAYVGQPYSPYGFHKSMLESLFSSYRATFDLNVAVVRLFSVYGEGLEKQLLWDLCNKLDKSDSNKVVLNGTGRELRDWLHVADATQLLWMIGNLDASANHIVNGGTGLATSILQLARITAGAWGEDHEIEFNGIARKGDPQCLIADTDLSSSLGFVAHVPVVDGVRDVVEWFKARK